MKTIIINGENHDFEGDINLNDLLSKLEIEPKTVAIELNLNIVPRSLWSETILQNGDKLELVQFVGGGI